MAQSIKLGSDTYLDASGVEVNASNTRRRPLNEWLTDIWGFNNHYFASGGTTATIRMANSTRLVVFVDSIASSGKNIFIVASSSDGTVSYKALGGDNTQLPVTTGTGTFTLTNNVSAGINMLTLTLSGSVVSIT